MRTLELRPLDTAFLVLAGAAPPLVVAGAMLVGGSSLPAVTLLGITLVWYAALFAGLVEESKVRAGKRRAEDQAADAMARDPFLELLDTIPTPVAPLTMGVASTTGVCALGFRSGDTWKIGAGGRLSRPLCRPALTALGSILEEDPHGETQPQFSCRCPLGGRELVFAFHEEAAA